VAERRVGVLGAGSLVAGCLLPLLQGDGWQTVAFSRRDHRGAAALPASLPFWISLAPIWALPAHIRLLEEHGVRRIVALSSTSRFSKRDAADPAERSMARRLAEGEAWLAAWAATRGVQWVILRPTLIYGAGRDRNVSEIARFIRRFGFFPLLGEASGLRQPVHAEDVARACAAALDRPAGGGRAYELSGGETLSYRDMVCRIFAALGCRPRLPVVPLRVFAAAAACARLLPRYRHWRAGMAERMNRDLVFDHAAAARDLGFTPRAFVLSPADLGKGL
jgi:nucleoside-diphosphate-sugar epimerase